MPALRKGPLRPLFASGVTVERSAAPSFEEVDAQNHSSGFKKNHVLPENAPNGFAGAD
jgi:hypothetical protein